MIIMAMGRPRKLPSEKLASGTLRPHREVDTVVLVTTENPPTMPDWLTAAGREVWADDMPRATQLKLATEFDSTSFATYCNLQGACIESWRENRCPPMAALDTVRKLAEQFGLLGTKSRLVRLPAPTKAPGGNDPLPGGFRRPGRPVSVK